MIEFFTLCTLIYWCLVVSHEHKVVKDSLGNFYYLSFNHREYLRPLADDSTVSALGFDPNAVQIVDNSFLDKFKRLPAFESLKMKNNSPDETMRVMIFKILTLSYPSYVIETYQFKGKLNPSIELIGDAILMAYRDHVYDSPIKFAWLNKTDLSYLPSNYSSFGIDNFITPDIPDYEWGVLQEDPRLMFLSDTKELYIQYHAKKDVMSAVRTAVCVATPESRNPNEKSKIHEGSAGNTLVTKHDTDGQYKVSISSSNTADYSNAVVIDASSLAEFRNSKNWVMFHHASSRRMLFIENINPMQILEPFREPEREMMHNISVRTVLSSKENVTLPWLDEYGPLIRGGTPGILVPTGNGTSQVYLSFFHTVAGFQMPYLTTYFMGAFTFCPEFPFNIHSMSSTPFVPSQWLYDGEWVRPPVIDYVVFPTGIVLVDKETLLISFGSQDKDGYVLRMSLPGLLASMDHVQECVGIGGGEVYGGDSSRPQ